MPLLEDVTSKTGDIRSLADADILKLSLEHPELFRELVDRYQRAFVRKALSILGNEEDAHDVVQETFVRIYAHGKKFEPRAGASFSSWAYAILVNQAYTLYRKNKKLREASVPLEEDAFETIPDRGAALDHERKLSADHAAYLISKLPALLRRTVTLRFVEGKAQKDIAEIEGVSVGVVKTRIHRAKKALKDLTLAVI